MNVLRKKQRTRRNSSNLIGSTEKWRTYGRRMSRRGQELLDEDLDDYEPQQSKDPKNWIEELFERKDDDQADQDIDVQLTKKQTLILSTLVPDEILLMDKFESTDVKRFVGVLLMADVSGYTALSERYSNTGKGGTYRLTVTLNTYLGSLIELIYSHGGDIIKFAGDAFLALWKTDKRTFLCHTIHTVIACALIIQHSYSSYETDVKVNLKVKLAISAGNLIFAPIGSGIDMNYIIFGLPVLEAKAAESVCASGEVKLTPTAWGHCYSRNYDHIIHENGFVTIKSILYDPHDSNVHRPFAGFGSMISKIKKQPFCGIENLPDGIFDSSRTLNVLDALKKNETLSLRKAILVAEEKNIGSQIRKFMIRPVLTQVDAHQPLEYLTEMRQVSILFITLKPRDCSFSQLITIVNNSYKISCEIVYKSMGCVNKIILFDKDIMILVVFGLRGFKHESEAQAALKCAYSIKKSVSALDGVLEVSIGVTTGQVYCGVVGHPLRREFTVIGAIVNKAARLMCGFRNKITCDEMTFVKSKMSSNGFTLQQSIELKGIVKPGKIYEYTEDIRVKELYDIPMITPLLNRTDEIEYFENWIEESNSQYRDFDALLIVGESRIGKTRLLEWMARQARNSGFRVCCLNLTSIHSATAYLGLSQIMNQILDLKEPIEGFAKEEKIIELLNTYSEDLCYLNNIIKVRFAYHEGIHSLDESKRKEKAKTMFQQLIKELKETYIIFLDDLQNLDSLSWEFISLMFNSTHVYIVLSVSRGKFSDVHSWLYRVFINNNIRKICLGPLDNEWIPALACQILDVNGVSKDLCVALQNKCKGMPGLVESFIIHLFSSGALEIKRIQDTELSEWEEEDLQFPDPALLHPTALDSRNQDTLDRLIRNDDNGIIGICIVTNKDELNTNVNAHNLDALIMVQIDSLTPYQQLLLKIASVIGNAIPRDLLENIMYENDWLVTAKAVKRLFALRVISCANADCLYKFGRRRTSTITITSTTYNPAQNLNCECSFDHDPETCENLPKYAFCKLMRFRNKNSRKTFYELLPINQKKEFHTRIVTYLENNKQKCTNCGGTIMVVESMLSLVDDTINKSCSTFGSASTLVIKEENSENDSEEQEVLQVQSSLTEQSSNTLLRHKSDSHLTAIKDTLDIAEVSSEILPPQTSIDSHLHEKRISQYLPILKRISIDPQGSGQDRRKSQTKKVKMTDFPELKQASSEEIENIKIYEMFREITEASDSTDWHKLGIIDSQEDINENNETTKPFSVKIEKGVSSINFAKCTCAELNTTLCEQVVYHARRADMKLKAIEFLIKFCYLCIQNNITENVFPKLEEAEELSKALPDSDSFERKRCLGKIYSIRAALCLMKGLLAAAKIEIEKATNIYNINLYKVPEYLKLKNIAKTFNFKRQKQRQHQNILKADSVYCLNVATLLYSMLRDERISRYTAVRAVNIVQKVECSVVDVCDTYSNGIQVELDRGTPEATAEIENSAATSLKNFTNPIQAEELFAVGKLFMASFRARIARGSLLPCIRSGFRALAISRLLQAEDISLELIPDLFYVLLTRRRIVEAVDILQFALRSGIDHTCFDSETWYHALCIDLILDAGFQLESPQDISRYAEHAICKGKSAGPSRRRLIIGLWTYWLRADSEKRAKRFETEALSWTSQEESGTLTNLLSAMRLAEGMLESLARKVDDLRKVVDLMELRSIADRELARLENDARLIRTLYPRWCLLKANSAKLSGRYSVANTFFNQAAEEARKINNRLEESLARATTASSVFWIQSARTGTFINWREGENHARNGWHEIMYRISTTRR